MGGRSNNAKYNELIFTCIIHGKCKHKTHDCWTYKKIKEKEEI